MNAAVWNSASYRLWKIRCIQYIYPYLFYFSLETFAQEVLIQPNLKQVSRITEEEEETQWEDVGPGGAASSSQHQPSRDDAQHILNTSINPTKKKINHILLHSVPFNDNDGEVAVVPVGIQKKLISRVSVTTLY